MRGQAPQHVAITGAGGQLGRALVDVLSPLVAQLSVSDLEVRDLDFPGRAPSQERAAELHPASVDVGDDEALRRWLTACRERAPLDWIIVNAGLGGPAPQGAFCEDPGRTASLIEINLLAAIEQCRIASEMMIGNGGGRIVLISSLSALIGYPDAPVYAATKAGLRAYGLSMSVRLAGTGVGITIALPGFLSEGMTEGGSWRPFSVTPEQAARQIVRAASSGRTEISFPRPMSAAIGALGLLPATLRGAVYRRWSGRSQVLSRS
ncbi:SDR family NAD(P)-dependent oxidoreductase [Roseibium marinum]|uniref:Short-subunit dehydrogenase n=1 Tax=Roseibium marinum TaxID=281252 RepID=A0A2S3UK32_9HYPH|nr:SDR family NAD(P)-dependent oxidoreductase [Roseibium marinum]POF28057.1 short-subunit dehydrogenase [Roseibium marinum]